MEAQLLPPEKIKTPGVFPDVPPARAASAAAAPERDPLRHQVIEVPAIEPDVTEYVARVTCDCGKVTRAKLPSGVPRGMCGPRLIALIGMLTGVYKLSRREAARLLSDVLGIEISLGALSDAEADVSEAVVGRWKKPACTRATIHQERRCHRMAAGRAGSHALDDRDAAVTVFAIVADGSRRACAACSPASTASSSPTAARSSASGRWTSGRSAGRT